MGHYFLARTLFQPPDLWDERVHTPPLMMHDILDKLATLEMPIWFTEVDISNKLDVQTQPTYLEQVLREAYAHSAGSGIVKWFMLH
jgi:hypothetical protein